MNLENITIVNFKNLVECQLDFSPNINCFIGNNGMGKTNVLDAIYYLSFVKSCSNVSDQLVLNHAADYMMLRGRYSRCGEPLEVAMAYQKGKRKTLKRDGKEYKRFSQHIGLLPLVMVSPMDWDLIRGSGEERRRLMDQIIAQGNQEYLAHLIRYNKALENRNSLIKQGMRDALLFETVEHQLNESGTAIHAARMRWIDEFTPIFMRYYNAIAGGAEQVQLQLSSHLNDCPMHELLNRNRDRDMMLATPPTACTATTSTCCSTDTRCVRWAAKVSAKPTPLRCVWLNTISSRRKMRLCPSCCSTTSSTNSMPTAWKASSRW